MTNNSARLTLLITFVLALPTIGLAPQTVAQDGAAVKRELSIKPITAPEGAEQLKFFRFELNDKNGKVTGVLVKPSGDGPFPGVVINHGRGGGAQGFGLRYGTRFAKDGIVAIACDYEHGQVPQQGRRQYPNPQPRSRNPDRQGEREGAEQQRTRQQQPQQQQPRVSAWDTLENQRRALECIAILQEQPEVDRERIAMYGNSMGAFLTIRMAQRTDRFHAAILTAGGLWPNPQNSALTEDVAKIKIPFLILIGETDFVERGGAATGLKTELDKHGIPAELKSFAGIGHNLIHQKTDELFELMSAFLTRQFDHSTQ